MTMTHRRGRSRDGLAIGVVLVLLGVLFLSGRLGIYRLGEFWDWWPLVPFAFGLVRVVTWHSAEEVGSGVMFMFLGVWFWVATHEWRGLHWGNSWPLALVAMGGGMVVRALLAPWFARLAPRDLPSGGEHHA